MLCAYRLCIPRFENFLLVRSRLRDFDFIHAKFSNSKQSNNRRYLTLDQGSTSEVSSLAIIGVRDLYCNLTLIDLAE